MSLAFLNQCKGEEPEVSLIYKRVETKTLKPPLRSYIFDLEIQNTSKAGRWYLWIDGKVDKMARKIVFLSNEIWDPDCISVSAIECSKLGGIGKFIVVDFSGRTYEDSFSAMYVPADSKIKIENFSYNSFQERSSLTLFEMERLMVNGKVSLQDWFPFDISNSKNVKLKIPLHGIISEDSKASLPVIRKQDLKKIQKITCLVKRKYVCEIPKEEKHIKLKGE